MSTSTIHDLNCFFIVGAPRCGTTALSSYLRQHPLVCFAKPKETNFLATAEEGVPNETLKDRFLETFFASGSGEERMLGEGSVSTLYSVKALERALAWFPKAKFIVMLRNPLGLLRSYHGRMLYLRQENEESFEAAWDLQDARAAGNHIPKGCFDPRLLQYREVASLGYYTEQLFNVVGREQCLPILFEDFTSNTAGVYRQALAFLGLPDDGRDQFKRKNQQRRFKRGFLQDLYTGALFGRLGNSNVLAPPQLNRLARLARPLRKRIKHHNSVDVTPRPFDPALARRLRAVFREDVGHLSRLLQRDLSHWLALPKSTVPEPSQLPHHSIKTVHGGERSNRC